MDELHYIYIYYMNDEQAPITVQVNHVFFFDPNNPLKPPKIEYFTLEKSEAKVFKIECPEGSIPYVKKWRQQVLLTYSDLSSHSNMIVGEG